MKSLITIILSAICIYVTSVNLVLAQKNNNLMLPLDKINSYADEGKIHYDKDNDKIYFVRKYHEQNIGGKNDPGDVWYIKKNENTWGEPINSGKKINNENENIIIGISDKGKTLWLYGQYDDLSRVQRKSYIFSYNVSSTNFKRQKIKYYHNSSKNPTFFVNDSGNIMVLAINTFDSYGLEDLYISFLEPENSKYHWSKPKNLGQIINTEFQEQTPYLSDDDISLFFSSNGHPGNGSLDIFLTQRKNYDWNSWSTPYHLQSNVNTIAIDNCFILFNKTQGLFSTTFNSFGYGDIKTVNWNNDERLNEINFKTDSSIANHQNQALDVNKNKINGGNTREINGEISDSHTNKMLEAMITLNYMNENGNKKTLEYKTKEKGFFRINLNKKINERQNQMVEIKVSSDGYLSKLQIINTRKLSKKVNFKLEKLEKGTTIQLKNVLFKPGTSIMLEESKKEIDQVAEAMLKNEKMKIKLRGHTDGIDNDSNVVLSEKRVEKVKKYLIEQGIDSSKIKGKGFGSKMPLYNNEDDLNRKKNRRVEFNILNY